MTQETKPPRPTINPASAPMRLLAHLPAFLLLSTLIAVPAHAQATWYLTADMAKGASWRNPAFWNSAPDGSGKPAAAINPADTYDTNGHYVRANGLFPGGKLLQNGGRIDMKRASQTIAGDWEITGAKASLHQGIRNGASYLFTVSHLILTSPLLVFHSTDGMRGIDLTIGVLTGPSDLAIGSGNPARNTVVSLGVLNFDHYTGKIVVTTGSTLMFANDQTWTGPLDVASGAHLTLNKTVSVPSATLDGKPVPAGTYTAAQLSQLCAGILIDGSDGTLTVTAPAPTK